MALVAIDGGETLVDPNRILLAERKGYGWTVYTSTWEIRHGVGYRASNDEMLEILSRADVTVNDCGKVKSAFIS